MLWLLSSRISSRPSLVDHDCCMSTGMEVDLDGDDADQYCWEMVLSMDAMVIVMVQRWLRICRTTAKDYADRITQCRQGCLPMAIRVGIRKMSTLKSSLELSLDGPHRLWSSQVYAYISSPTPQTPGKLPYRVNLNFSHDNVLRSRAFSHRSQFELVSFQF